MALKQVIAARKKQLLAERLEALKKKRDELNERAKTIQTREEELEAAANEMTAETSAEDQAAFESVVKDFEAEKAAHGEEVRENDTKIGELENEIAGLDEELNGYAEEAQRAAAMKGEKRSTEPEAQPQAETRKGEFRMNSKKFFRNMSIQERDAFIAREDVKKFLGEMRELGKQNRSITGAELTIPDNALDLIRDQIGNYSKLYGIVNTRAIKGTSRVPVAGLAPEAVWTEACATLNELNLSFGQVSMDGFKVGGFIAVCNAILEDSDINLADFIFDALAQAIGLALDKAIVYGTGTKMPVGIVTRLAQATQPSDWDPNAPAWVDLHTSNVITIASSKTGKDLFKELGKAGGKAKSRYSKQQRVWVMNDATKLKLQVESLDVNAAGSIVAGVNDTMPVIGGRIITVTDDVLADDVIVCGFMDLYILVERAGMKLDLSGHVRFVEDQTVFKGTARYDGTPVFGEAFVVIGLGSAPATTANFAADTANP